jgi:hypothetical protein
MLLVVTLDCPTAVSGLTTFLVAVVLIVVDAGGAPPAKVDAKSVSAVPPPMANTLAEISGVVDVVVVVVVVVTGGAATYVTLVYLSELFFFIFKTRRTE